jgi:D-alanyl-D-alanine dipeptidase
MTADVLKCESLATHPDFQHLRTLHGVDVDLRYASCDNFLGRNFYQDTDCAYLRADAAMALECAAQWIATHRPGMRLRVLDAVRPQRVQEALYAELEGTPLTMYLAHPNRGSIHSFGMAVDVTLLDASGQELEMGSGFDEMTLLSHPDREAENMAMGALSPQHLEHRGWLRAAMRQAGFQSIHSEWWHFDFGDRVAVRRDLPRIY